MPGTDIFGENYRIEETSDGDFEIIDQNNGITVFKHDNSTDTVFINSQIDTVDVVSDLVDAAGVSHTGELADLTDIVDDHGNLTGLSDDDHTQYVLVDGSRAMTGPLDTPEVQNQDYNEAVDSSFSTASGTLDIDLSVSNWYEIQADGDITISFSNVSGTPPGNSLILYFEDSDGTGPHTISWPASVVWDGGTVEDTIPSNSDIEITLRSPDGGTTWRANLVGEEYS